MKELFLTQTHTLKLKHIERVILTHTTKGKLNKQPEKHKCIIRDISVHPNIYNIIPIIIGILITWP